jgi:tetratricopeptide (TPR) repeat protein
MIAPSEFTPTVEQDRLAEPPLSPPGLRLVREPEALSAEHEAITELIARAEQAIEDHDYCTAVTVLEDALPATAPPDLAFRALLAESWAHMSLGELDHAVALLERARTLAERPSFTDVDRAEALFRLGCCRLLLSNVANAASLLAVALELCDRSGRPCDLLRAHILDWRARCYQSQRDFEAARADVERALELAEAAGDERTLAHIYFQASIVAERQKQWIVARLYAEEALDRCERLGDRASTHKVLNNLGGISFLLGDLERATACLKDAFRIALELESDVGAAYAMSSLAQVQLRSGEPVESERHARKALELLAGRRDHSSEIGNAQLVLGRSLLEQGRLDEAGNLLRAAEESFSSVSQRAAAWVAQGDLAARRGDKDAAAGHYRRAAEALQDFHF